MLPTKDNFEYKHTEWVKVTGWKKIYRINSKHKKAKDMYQYLFKYTSSQRSLPEIDTFYNN